MYREIEMILYNELIDSPFSLIIPFLSTLLTVAVILLPFIFIFAVLWRLLR